MSPATPVLPAVELERIRVSVSAGRWDEAATIAEALWQRLETGRIILSPEELDAAIRAHEACEREAQVARQRLLSDAARLHGGHRAALAYAQTGSEG